jgi:flagellar export protein FliJ
MSARRLAAVRRVRQLQEDAARGELARSNERLRQAAEAEQRTWRQLDASPESTSMPGRQLHGRWAVRAAGTLAAGTQQRVTEHAGSGVVTARDAWSVAARRVEALERLDERQRSEEAIELDRKRSVELDDMVLARRSMNGGAPR